MNQDNHIVLVGLPGVGKTSIGEKLSEMLMMDYIDIDYEIESDQEIAINDFIQSHSVSEFRLIEKDKLDKVLDGNSPLVISSGGGIVLDKGNRNLIKEKSVGVYIKCDIDEIANRVDIKSRPLLYNTNKKPQLLNFWNERKEMYSEVSKIEVDITGLDLKKSIIKVYNKINE